MTSKIRPHCARTVVALIATHDREHLLLSRAIPSVLAQTTPPDRLIVVLDKSKDEMSGERLAAFARRLQSECGELPVSVLRNFRTPRRAAGAWNTGLDQLHRDARLIARPELCFVAILDDDDAWEPDHIQVCLDAAIAGDFGMVASGLVRHEQPGDEGHRHSIPEALDARELFIRGQHIQGSNLFVRLDIMLKAGCFDEYLPSCTDRDLCIRLVALPGLRFGRVERYTVHHFADRRPDRLSAPGSEAKLEGLTRFWRKYADRFDDAARREFVERAERIFGWRIPEPSLSTTAVPLVSQPPRPVSLIAGFVTDAIPPGHVRGLLEDLLALASNPSVSRLAVVVVENGPLPAGGERPLHVLANKFRSKGLDLHLITIEQQREDWAKGMLLESTPDPSQSRLPIAVTRTILNTYVAQRAEDQSGAWAWILDDDKRLSVRVDCGGHVIERPSPDLAALCVLKDAGVDVVIGPDTEAAPLPFTATLRGQLVDLEHHLRLLSAVAPEAPVADRFAADSAVRASLKDSYYDLSRLTEHLETPLALASPRSSR